MRKNILLLSLLTMMTLRIWGQLVYNVHDYGAFGNGNNLDTKAIQKAIDVCCADSGGVVFFPPGTYVSGTLYLKSHVTLKIDRGAILQGSKNLSDYQLQPANSYCRITGSRYVFLYCSGMHNISVTGEGIIDGLRLEDSGMGVLHGRGPMAVFFENTDNIRMEGITIKNAAGWSLTFFGCKEVRASDIKILNGRADGINPVCCSDVLLDACIIDGSGDDPITIKNEGTPNCGHITKDIIIRNCVVRNTSHPAIKIGTGTAGVFRNIFVTGCIFENTGDVFTIQLMRPSLAINPERVIENVTVSDIIARNVKSFIDITTIAVDKPVIKNLRIHDIIVDGVKQGSRIWGTSEAPINHINIQNVLFNSGSGNTDPWLSTNYLSGLVLNRLKLDLNENAGSILDFKNGSGLQIDQIDRLGIENSSLHYSLYQAENVRIKACPLKSRIPIVSINGNHSKDIYLFSDIPFQDQPAIVGSEVRRGVIWPGTTNVEVLEITQEGTVYAGENGEFIVKLHNIGAGGMYKLQLFESSEDLGSQWLWLGPNETGDFHLKIKPLYKTGSHEIAIQQKKKTFDVLSTPPRIVVNDTMKVINYPGDRLKFELIVTNTGGEKGSKTIRLYQDGTVVDEKTIEVEAGEAKNVGLESKIINGLPFCLKVDEFPDWFYQTSYTVKSDFYFTKKGNVIIDAGGRIGVNEDYGAVYMNDVEGDFDAVAKFGSLEASGEYAAIGLIVRNELTDTISVGFTTYSKVLKYGGMTVWRKDLNGDGKFDQNSFEGGNTWVQLSKRGKNFSLYTSEDGNKWNKSEIEYTIDSADHIQDVGIFGNSYNNNSRNRVSFNYFKVTPLKN